MAAPMTSCRYGWSLHAHLQVWTKPKGCHRRVGIDLRWVLIIEKLLLISCFTCSHWKQSTTVQRGCGRDSSLLRSSYKHCCTKPALGNKIFRVESRPVDDSRDLANFPKDEGVQIATVWEVGCPSPPNWGGWPVRQQQTAIAARELPPEARGF